MARTIRSAGLSNGDVTRVDAASTEIDSWLEQASPLRSTAAAMSYGDVMSLADDFEAAQTRVQALSSAPSQSDMLALYGLFKQAKVGDVQGKRPGMLDLKGRAKYDAWAERKGTSKDDAMKAYVDLVDRLAK